MDRLISEFLDYLRYERNKSLHTIRNYRLDLQLFCEFVNTLDEGVRWQDVDGDIIRGWMEDMMDKGRSSTSINRRLSSLRSFFRFAMLRGYVEVDPSYGLRGPKNSRPLPQYLQEGEMDCLLGDDVWGDDFCSVRARTIILTFYSTGMRLSELVALDDGDIDFVSQQIKVLGKRNKERMIPFGKELEETIKDYISLRDATMVRTTSALFVGDKGQRIGEWKVRRDVQKYLSRVTTMKKRSPHVLRHTFATAMLNNDAGLESIKALLGHESVATTEIYTHTTFEQLQKVYSNAHPRGDGAEK